MALIELSGVERVFASAAGEVHALHPTDLAIEAGQLAVILGPSGSGKTTLLNLIGGLDHPSQGQLVVDGLKVGDLSTEQLSDYRREKVGVVFQFFNLIPSLTALENVELAAELVDEADDPAGLLARVGLEGLGDRFPHELSGGQQQRVAICRALTKRPRVLLCDEPTGALDHETGLRVLEVLQEAAGPERAVLVVTHDLSLVPIADRVVRLRDGRIVSDEQQARRAATELES